jgi:hypothetical protein
MMIKDLIAYCASRINIQMTSAINHNVVPRVLFRGARRDYLKELCLHFGDYCKVYNRVDHTSRSRSMPCIALYPCSNMAGSWAFINLVLKSIIRRSQWVKMVTTDKIVSRMNSFDPEEAGPQ